MSKTTTVRKKKAAPALKTNIIPFPVKRDLSAAIARLDAGGDGVYFYHIPALLAVPLISIVADVVARVIERDVRVGDKTLFKLKSAPALLRLGEAVTLSGDCYIRELNGAGIAYPVEMMDFLWAIDDFKGYAGGSQGAVRTALQLLGAQGGAK